MINDDQCIYLYISVIHFDVGAPHFGSFQITRKTISINQRGLPVACGMMLDVCASSRDMIFVWVIEAAQESIIHLRNDNMKTPMYFDVFCFFCQYVDSCPCQYFGCPTKNDQRNSLQQKLPQQKKVQSIDFSGKTQRKIPGRKRNMSWRPWPSFACWEPCIWSLGNGVGVDGRLVAPRPDVILWHEYIQVCRKVGQRKQVLQTKTQTQICWKQDVNL